MSSIESKIKDMSPHKEVAIKTLGFLNSSYLNILATLSRSGKSAHQTKLSRSGFQTWHYLSQKSR